MSYVVGCDFDTKAIHLVYLDENDVEAPHYFPIVLRGDGAFARTRDVRHAMSHVGLEDVLAFGIEHPAGTHGSQVLMRVQGAILACLPTSLLVQDWPPGKWRKAVGLPGNCSKDAVAKSIPTRSWNLDWPQDACDAYCIALATRAAIEREQDAA